MKKVNNKKWFGLLILGVLFSGLFGCKKVSFMDKKVYTEDTSGNKYFIENIEEYLELKSYGNIIKIL